MLKVNNSEFLGQFKIKSDVIRVSDPCYKKDTWCAGNIDNIKTGTWEGYMRLNTSCNRVSELIAYHVDTPSKVVKGEKWVEQSVEIGVDSGTCGIFDESKYPVGETGEFGDTNTFYGKCCELTTSDFGGVLDFGVVSSSGYGDGSYICYTVEDKLEVTGIKITFIENDEDDDEVEELNYEYDESDGYDDYYDSEDDY